MVVSSTMVGKKASLRRGLMGSVGTTDMLTLVVSEGDADIAVMPTSLCCRKGWVLVFVVRLCCCEV